MFSFEGVCKRFGDLVALQPLDLDVPVGRTLVLIGESGSGKSTALRLMIGLERPDSGRVLFEGEPVCDENVASIRRRVGYVIQEGGLFPHLTAYANATLLAGQLGWSPERCRDRIHALRELTQLDESVLDRFPGELSGGQRQRVALMRALMLDPDVVLLDEPLGALDPIIRYELQDELVGIFETLAKTVVLVTHDVAEAAHLGDDLVLLHEGRVVQAGSYAHLRDAPANDYAARFIAARRDLPAIR